MRTPGRGLSLLFPLLSSLAGCESGTSEYHVIDVVDAAADAFSADAPGLLRTEGGYDLVAVLCGDRLPEPAELSIDFGFGCLDDALAGTEATRRAWVEPMPATWDAAALCAMPAPDPAWRGVQPGADVTGTDANFAADLAAEVDPAWPQGTGTGTWKRDLSPCGGNLNVEITVE